LTANYSNLVVIYRDGTFRHAQWSFLVLSPRYWKLSEMAAQQEVQIYSSLMTVLNIDLFQCPCFKNTVNVWSQLDGLHEITFLV